MNLEKAIEILTLDKDCEYEGDSKDLEAALQLGIEAAQRIQVGRNNPGTHWNGLLPGETQPRPLHSLGFNTGDDESP